MTAALSLEAKRFLEENGNKTVVFTNGCFDILHAGHIQYLNEAKACGDVLFVGLNSDSSVKISKGSHRPINRENDRKYILENLKCVDFVEIFQEETPYRLIKEVMPRVLVKGGDWKREDIVGLDLIEKNGGTVKALTFKEGYSTSGIIERLGRGRYER